MKAKLIGTVILIVVITCAAGYYFYGKSTDVTVINGYLGGEKIGIMEDTQIADILAKKYHIAFEYSRAGSLDMVTADQSARNYLFPSSRIALEYYKEQHGEPVSNDRILVDKIQTAVLNTIPIWKSQFVIAMGLNNQQRVLKMQREITDTINKMLLKNSELLKTNTVETARESNRGIVDIETLQKVNQNLISTIEETIQIHKEGRHQRVEAEKMLGRIEDELKNKLVAIINN